MNLRAGFFISLLFPKCVEPPILPLLQSWEAGMGMKAEFGQGPVVMVRQSPKNVGFLGILTDVGLVKAQQGQITQIRNICRTASG